MTPFDIHHCDADPAQTGRNVRLRYGIHTPPQATGHVLILQGRAEFIERYDETAVELAERGLGCVTFDFRGQGGSAREVADRNMGYVADISHYVADAHAILTHIHDHHGLACDMVMTHSTGGLVGLEILHQNPGRFASALMIAPFFGLGGADWMAILAQFISGGLCRYGFDRQFLPGQRLLSPLQPYNDNNLLTSDRGRYDRNVACLQANPDLMIGGVSAGWLDACFRAQAMLGDRVSPDAALPPVSILLAEKDQVVNNRVTRDLFAGHPGVQIHDIPNSRHEILQERDDIRARFWHHFDDHLRQYHPAWTTTPDN
ncbi:alpha/beta fold hydrolase [Thalassospira sp.]|uniref:alpha/beta fold hydrolase n=1 Tax=Thalassospira sp. TaxID=1912094 RepID=UPI002732A17D|nr:alpha/beta hydrolase [Thalassospira sp.]MDP2700160.1 alpha/beta hydrolase [Thalassospira sp.]